MLLLVNPRFTEDSRYKDLADFKTAYLEHKDLVLQLSDKLLSTDKQVTVVNTLTYRNTTGPPNKLSEAKNIQR